MSEAEWALAVRTAALIGPLARQDVVGRSAAAEAAGASLAAKARTTTALTVFAVEDPAVMDEQFEKSAAALGNCSKFTIEVKGKKLPAK